MSQPFVTQKRAGQVVGGRYKLERPLGEGAFGEVWLSSRAGDGPAVVKILHPQWARVPSVVERFRREALATTRVNHPNVCRIFEYVAPDDGSPFIAMEYLSGGTLKAALEREGGAMTVGRAAALMAPVCEAVAAAHAVSIVHRDLKPDNIMLTTRDGQEVPIVLDFGIAKLLDATEKLTQTGSMLGTPAYMSPEQCQGKPDLGPSTDVYALAVIVFELLVGEPPFSSNTLAEMAMKHLLEPPAALGDVPAPLAEAVAKCLAKDARDRPSAAVLAGALREAATTAPNAHARPIEIPNEQRLNPNEKPTPRKRPSAKRASSHEAATVISTDAKEIEARTRALLEKARGSTGPPPAMSSAAPGDRARSAGISPLAIALIVAAVSVLGALVGLLITR